ncbi:uncharacterized protein LOC126894346 isoform X2 [Daktulosphaira vitifoliae]|nr:uncharacterized protein LOC126894346 isoform X2 [Daktulosphaira vitifoliae]XP_050521247.1 uncharacterized protein LOC126894346 isoform X2 [Daktulosphaira vitifoliae]XP_050521248.1 uncharacterized protein LOC126894346 isoform X2 [Daktulosphaira vitifoliae]
MEESTEKEKDIRDELDKANEIFKEIFCKAPTLIKDLNDDSVDIDFKECVADHLDLLKIDAKLKEGKYGALADVIIDIRKTLLNCYKYYGIKNENTLKVLKFEELLEKTFECLNENLRKSADVQLTLKLLNLDNKPDYKFRYPKNCYDSLLLRSVAHCRPERLKEYHKVLSNTLTTDEDSSSLLEELLNWENEVCFNDHYRYISSMWELPEIGNLISILFRELDFEIINQGEIERMFLMPKESLAMSKIMTTLLIPIKKLKHIDKVMPYKVWSEKLSKKVSEWYKVYHSKKRNKVNVLKSLGIHPDFWAVIGDRNPLVHFDYCELSYLMKVWLIKGLCDYVINKYKTVSDIVVNCNERQETIWKNEMETEEYFYFKTIPDLRLYYYQIPNDEPDLDFLNIEEVDEEDREGAVQIISGIHSLFRSRSRVKPNSNNFKLIADSVQGIRSFINALDTDDTCVPDSLINSLEDFVVRLESEECNLIVLNNNSKIKLFKDWKSYPERSKHDDDILFWEEKETKQSRSDTVTNEEIIQEKRKRKVVIHQEFDVDIHDSDEYFTDKTNESVCDFSDSEDEWGVINQTKNNKSKQLTQAPSKIVELEKRLREESKIPKKRQKNNYIFNDIADSNALDLPDDIKCVNDTLSNNNILECKQVKESNESLNSLNKNIILHDKSKILESKPLNSVEVITLDDDNSNSCDYTDTKTKNSTETNDIISIQDDDDQIIISDDEDDIQIVSVTPKLLKTPTRDTNFKRNNSYVTTNKSLTTYRKRNQAITTNLPKLPPNVSIIPANVHLPKDIQVTVVKKQQTTIASHFNATKRYSSTKANGFLSNSSREVNVKCKVISKSNFKGEVKFYVSLPNGNHHPVSDELINQYLKEHNNRLPDYWLVPLPIEVAKQYGF